MEISVAHIQPIIEWLRFHPQWAAIIIFLISFCESLAVIGSLVPGSVMMTMVGILAGTGVVNLKVSIIAAILGAIAGDGGSYFLGYYFSEKLPTIWPFYKYPQWLKYGKSYFERHGGKSVFLGRFVGPLRSLIPAIAGMMKMPQLNFFIANALSAVGWSFLYMGPGILIGAASASLSAETATKLFLFIIGLMLLLWLLGIALNKLWIKSRDILNQSSHHLWCRAQHTSFWKPITQYLTPQGETQHGQTCLVFLSCLSFILISTLLLNDIMNNAICTSFDFPIYFSLQTIRTQAFDVFFTVIILLMNPISISAIILAEIGYATFTKNFRLVRYWISLCSFFIISFLVFNYFLDMNDFIVHSNLEDVSYTLLPTHCYTSIVAIFSFFILRHRECCSPLIQQILKYTTISLLFFMSVTLLYLGENWFSGILIAFCIGLSLGLVHWLLYRRHQTIQEHNTIVLIPIVYIITAIIVIFINFENTFNEHKPSTTQYMLTHKTWWEQKKPLLPIYSSNRLGRPVGLFNLQYMGDIEHLQRSLQTAGWKKQSTSLVANLIAKTEKNHIKIPLKERFYLNKKPDLIMSYGENKTKPILLLSLWRSNFHLLYHHQPLWIGSIEPYRVAQFKHHAVPMTILFNPLFNALHKFKIRTLTLINTELPIYETSEKLFIIQEAVEN